MSFSQLFMCWKKPKSWQGRNVVLIPGESPKFNRKQKEKSAIENKEHTGVAEQTAKKSLLGHVRSIFAGNKPWSGRHVVLLPGEPPRFSHERNGDRKQRSSRFFQTLKGLFTRRNVSKGKYMFIFII